jgi:hypothetical protein
VTKKVVAPYGPKGEYCLAAFADGEALPKTNLIVKEIYVNGKRVWKDGKQTRTAWIELERVGDGRYSKNHIEALVRFIPLYYSYDYVKVDIEGCGCTGGTGYTREFKLTDGEFLLDLEEIWDCGNADDLITIIKNWDDFTWSDKMHVEWYSPSKDVIFWLKKEYCTTELVKAAETTIPEDGRYMIVFDRIMDNWTGQYAYIEVRLNDEKIGSNYTGDSRETWAWTFEAEAGDTLEIWYKSSTSYPYCVAVWCKDIMLVKEQKVECTLKLKFRYTGPNGDEVQEIPIECRGSYDNWFGGPRWEEEQL